MKIKIWHLWPHLAPGWPLTLNKEGLKLMHMYDLYVTFTSYSIFGENYLLTPWTLNDPRLTFDQLIYIGSGSQANVYVWVLWSCCVRWTSNSILVKMTFCTLWPHMIPGPGWPLTHSISRRSKTNVYAWVLWLCYVTWIGYSIFGENDLLTPVTPKTTHWHLSL